MLKGPYPPSPSRPEVPLPLFVLESLDVVLKIDQLIIARQRPCRRRRPTGRQADMPILSSIGVACDLPAPRPGLLGTGLRRAAVSPEGPSTRRASWSRSSSVWGASGRYACFTGHVSGFGRCGFIETQYMTTRRDVRFDDGMRSRGYPFVWNRRSRAKAHLSKRFHHSNVPPRYPDVGRSHRRQNSPHECHGYFFLSSITKT